MWMVYSMSDAVMRCDEWSDRVGINNGDADSHSSTMRIDGLPEAMGSSNSGEEYPEISKQEQLPRPGACCF